MEQILNKALRFLKNPARYLKLLGKDDEKVKKSYVSQKYGLQKGLPVIDLLDMFPNFSETVVPYSFLEGTSLPIDLAVL